MVPIYLIPKSVCRHLLDGLGRLVRHLAGLSEDVRHGLIQVISRSVSESIESTLHGVSQRRNHSMSDTVRFESEDRDDSELANDRLMFEDNVETESKDANLAELVRERQERFANPACPPSPLHSASPWWLTMAAGLCGLASWFGSTGLTPLATATSILAGSILVFLG